MCKVNLKFDVDYVYNNFLSPRVKKKLNVSDIENIFQYYRDCSRSVTVDDFNDWVIVNSIDELLKKYNKNILGYLYKSSFCEDKPVSLKWLMTIMCDQRQKLDYEAGQLLIVIFKNELFFDIFELDNKIYVQIPFEYTISKEEVEHINFKMSLK